MAVIVSQGGAWVQGSAYLGYENFLRDPLSLITTNNESEDNPAMNILSWATYERYRFTMVGDVDVHVYLTLPQPKAVNCLGLFRHTLGNKGIRTRLQYSNDNGSTWTAIPETIRIHGAGNTVAFDVTDTPVTSNLWRLKIDNNVSFETNTFEIGNVFIGNALQLYSGPETGFTPPNLAHEDKFISNQSDSGEFLGRSRIRKAARTGFNISTVDADWVRDNYEPFLDAVQSQPFYFAWDAENRVNETAFCYLERPPAKPKYTSNRHMSIGLNFTALR